jgi:hypothetical protein
MAENMSQVAASSAMNGKKKKKNKKFDIPDLELTEEQKKAIRAGSARAWYADLPGAFTDLAGSALDYGAEGLARLLPSDLAGYDLPESLGIRGFQRGVRNPALGSKQMEQIGEDIGYIPKTTGTEEEERARLLMGLVDPMPGISPAVAGVFASNRAKNLPELSYAKAQAMEKDRKNPQEIFEETGFFKGPEGNWRFEIDDSQLKVKPENLKTASQIFGNTDFKEPAGQPKYAPLFDVIDHPELREAYPELEKIYIKFESPKSGRGEQDYLGYFSRSEAVPNYNEAWDIEEYTNRPTIAIVAPTKESEIKKLNDLVNREYADLQAIEQSMGSLQNPDRLNPLDEREIKHLYEMKERRKGVQAKIEGYLQEIGKLEKGGELDVPFSLKSTLVHELQHAVQNIEGLPKGGNPRTAFFDTERDIPEHILRGTGKTRDEVQTALANQDDALKDLYIMDDIGRLQFLESFILRDNPTQSARLIENSSMSYGMERGQSDRLGPRPKRYKKQEYGDYLRRKARIYQEMIIDKYAKDVLKNDRFMDVLSRLGSYELQKGADFPTNIGVFEPRDILKTDGYDMPAWLRLDQKAVKNYEKRLARKADKFREDAGLERKIVNKLEDLRNRKEDKIDGDSEYDFYRKLAGEAEARAVQKRLQLRDIEQGGTGGLQKFNRDEMALEDILPEDAPTVTDELKQVPTSQYDVPMSELGYVYPKDYERIVPRSAARAAYVR